MNYHLITVMIITLLIQLGVAQQEDWPAWKARTASQYHHTLQEGVDNFSFHITSQAYINFIEQHGDSSYYYPLKFIWTSPEDRFYVLQPLPQAADSDSLRREILLRVQDLKNLWEDMFVDIGKFILEPPMNSVPESAQNTIGVDTVGVRYKEGNSLFSVRETYAKNGLLGKLVWEMGNQRTVVTPVYKDDQAKWYCVGWQSQKIVNGEVTEGLVYSLQPLWFGGRYLTNQIDLVVQAQRGAEKEIVSGAYRIFLKNFKFNELIEVKSPANRQ